jgi:hypothetical protein
MTHSSSYRRILHRMGYYDYQLGLINHYLNENDSWNSHLTHCRDFILEAVEIVKPSKITVFGSGWLLDLPLAEMTSTCRIEKISLIDIIHPPEVSSQVKNFMNVELVEQDVSGGLIQEVWDKARERTFLNPLKTLDDIIIPEYRLAGDPGMILSLNILTQIEALPVKFIRKHSKVEDTIIRKFSSAIQEKHINLLKKHPSVLITDISEKITDQKGTVTEKQTLLTDLPESKFRKDWTWNFEVMKPDFYRTRSVFGVAAILIF